MENKTQTVVQSCPVLGLLGVAFVVLKLCGVINWSWWLVTLPFWGPVAFVVLILLGIAAFFLGGIALGRKRK